MRTENSNPYQTRDASSITTQKRATNWMIWSGTFTLLLAVLCVSATILGLMSSIDATATSAQAPDPADIAGDISSSLLPAVAAGPLTIGGIVLLVVGFLRRRSADET